MNEEMIAPCPMACFPWLPEHRVAVVGELQNSRGAATEFAAGCRDCDIFTDQHRTRAEAIAAWNTRTPAEPRPADGEMIETIAKAIFDDDDEQWARLPENYREPLRKQARRVLAAYNPNERLSEAFDVKVLKAAAYALLKKVDEDSMVRWKFVNERECLRSALSPLLASSAK